LWEAETPVSSMAPPARPPRRHVSAAHDHVGGSRNAWSKFNRYDCCPSWWGSFIGRLYQGGTLTERCVPSAQLI
jgi:hypothetical protein